MEILMSNNAAGTQEQANHPNFEDFIDGYHNPYLKGVKLAIRNFGKIARNTFPVAAFLAIALSLSGTPMISLLKGESESTIPSITMVVYLFFGAASASLTLSHSYLGIQEKSHFAEFMGRIGPWLLTWLLIITATIIGYLCLIIPGVIIGFRLFYADEFALTKNANPIEAIKKSWELTDGKIFDIYKFQVLANFSTLLSAVPLVALGIGIIFVLNNMGDLLIIKIFQDTVLFCLLLLVYSINHSIQIIYFYGLRAFKAV